MVVVVAAAAAVVVVVVVAAAVVVVVVVAVLSGRGVRPILADAPARRRPPAQELPVFIRQLFFCEQPTHDGQLTAVLFCCYAAADSEESAGPDGMRPRSALEAAGP